MDDSWRVGGCGDWMIRMVAEGWWRLGGCGDWIRFDGNPVASGSFPVAIVGWVKNHVFYRHETWWL